MYKAVLFDLDGTLTDTLRDIADAMNRALRLHDLPEFAVEDYKYLVGNGAKKLAERAVRDRLDLQMAVLRDYQAYYETHNLVTTKPYEGIPELLAALADRGLKLCVLSNKPHADTCHVVSHFFPQIPFAAVRGQMEGVPVKPDPTGNPGRAGELPVPGRYLGGHDLRQERGHAPRGRDLGLPHGGGIAQRRGRAAHQPSAGAAGAP